MYEETSSAFQVSQAQAVQCCEECNPAYEEYPNLHAGMVGYDVFKGNPFNEEGIRDPGFKELIFAPMIKQDDTRMALDSGVTAKCKESYCFQTHIMLVVEVFF